jgi:hypothetical protein
MLFQLLLAVVITMLFSISPYIGNIGLFNIYSAYDVVTDYYRC